MPDCPHPSPVGFVAWSAPMATIGGRERQAAEWCRRCGALGVWSEDGDRVEWFRPGALAEMPDCSAQDAPRTSFRGQGAGLVAGTECEALCGADNCHAYSTGAPTVLEGEDAERLLRDLDNVCSPEEARRRAARAKGRLAETMRRKR